MRKAGLLRLWHRLFGHLPKNAVIARETAAVVHATRFYCRRCRGSFWKHVGPS